MRPFKSTVSALVLTAFLCLSLIQPAAAQPAQPYTILWQRQITGGSGSAGQPPVISPWGDIFLLTGSGVLRLNDLGEQIWEFKTGDKPTSSPVFFDDGSTFVATAKVLYEVKPYGRPGWSFTVASGEKGSTASPPNLTRGPGDLFYLLLGRSLYAVAPRRNMLWYLAQSDYPVAVDAGRQYVFVARSENGVGTTLEALDSAGKSVWSRGFAEQKQVYLSLSPDGKYLYVVNIPKSPGKFNKCALYALDAAAGTIIWSRKFNQNELSNFTRGPDGLLHLVAGKRYLYGLDSLTGDERLSTQLLDLSGATPAVDREGTIYVPGKERLYAVSGSDGRLLWDLDLDGGVATTPALGSDGLTIYFTDGKGTLYALRPGYNNAATTAAAGASSSDPASTPDP
ncbi:outer membrane protein assembly factor BamB [Moorella thermoacetica]|uniref:Outer membrane protein assembly factor BamB n=1 Tax=Neomoorella thermoacetica TaxID=1525 RepID=A0A1J5NLD5_NEOTH|nr:outer membrane protein assembly factor BamB [Moorella thermoacetica]